MKKYIIVLLSTALCSSTVADTTLNIGAVRKVAQELAECSAYSELFSQIKNLPTEIAEKYLFVSQYFLNESAKWDGIESARFNKYFEKRKFQDRLFINPDFRLIVKDEHQKCVNLTENATDRYSYWVSELR